MPDKPSEFYYKARDETYALVKGLQRVAEGKDITEEERKQWDLIAGPFRDREENKHPEAPYFTRNWGDYERQNAEIPLFSIWLNESQVYEKEALKGEKIGMLFSYVSDRILPREISKSRLNSRPPPEDRDRIKECARLVAPLFLRLSYIYGQCERDPSIVREHFFSGPPLGEASLLNLISSKSL